MISRSLADGVQILRIDRPEKKNALTGAMYAALAEALEEGNTDDAIRCHLICGHPGAFTAGNDIADFLKYGLSGDSGDRPAGRFLKALVMNDKPLIAAVDGLAVGVGTTLLMHCDMIFASQNAVFKAPFVDLGLVPEAGSTLIGPKLMGSQWAFELLCLGETFSAERAEKAGLVNHVIDGDVEAAALDCARKLAAKPPAALAAARRLLKGDRDALLACIETETEIFTERLTAPETIATFEAFMTKKA
ncbi:crotonase/enoyl-CoA hydratase family protein [uncultured Roseibium sp.]|uniref:crotonase/enoyl-CoA hydratase family protein n=1 Tax=uncultured Roseibium sp. TaxID=1936171 RepID=UPI0032168BEF